MDDQVYRELAILKRDCHKLLKTIRILELACAADPRFGRLRPVKETPQDELFVEINSTGPQGLSDPFEVPLGGPFE